jgi:hypothetical protein
MKLEKVLINFLIDLNDKGLINNHVFDYDKVVKAFANKEENKRLVIANVVGSMPTRAEKNNLPEEVRYAFCEAIEMYHNIQNYEFGFIDRTDFINHTIAIKDKYK